MQNKPRGHVVLFSYEGWGHLRPLTVLAARIVKTRPTYVTFLTTPRFIDRVQAELSRSIDADDSVRRDLIRVIAMPVIEDGSFFNPIEINKAFASAYEQLVLGGALKCDKSIVTHGPVPIPTCVILDSFAGGPLLSVRKLSPPEKSVKVYAWYSAAATFMIWPFAPEDKGGQADYRPKVAAAIKGGRDPTEATEEIVFATSGEILRLPGLPPMYDYELQPQEMLLKGVAGPFWIESRNVYDTCDGVIMATPECYEPEAVAVARNWFTETSRKFFVLGPLLPATHDLRALAGEKQMSAKANEIAVFMESVFASHGKGSMLYISFGSIIWSAEPEKIWAFLDVVMDKKIPFLMSHASPLAVIPDAVREKVGKYGLGLLSQWSPQQTVLSHPVTGWFVTHCGLNSVLEAITAGVPMICWPYNADQPTNAANLSHNLDVAYELVEVRTGLGLKPILRSGRVPVGSIEAVREEAVGVLENAFLIDGERKRANIQRLRDAVLASWAEDGSATLSMEALVTTLGG